MYALMIRSRCDANDALRYKNSNEDTKNNDVGSESNVMHFVETLLQESDELESRVLL